ncbi:MAG: PilT/PilU family type 4a pilus ATPase [Rickettsiales bacterium]|nr:PilT/PilU family type 4a pilus ATPase [Rickettsiales bacterium]
MLSEMSTAMKTRPMQPLVERIAELARSHKLSDIHIHSDEPLAMRVHGLIEMIPDTMISAAEVGAFVESILDKEQKQTWEKQKDVDLALAHEELRFRVNSYHTSRGPAVVLRKIETQLPTMEDLHLPQAVIDITQKKNGLVLVTGPTGSGKSTTLAALIDKINGERQDNIITVEDPIEFIHQSKRSLVSQREVGRDAATFATALRAMLREDPDVILVGEMRDLETIALALTAAETGHLVFGTLHTNGAPNSINRILDVFPPQQQAQARAQLSQSLRLVVTQRLISRADQPGRVAAFEVMVNNVATANLIRENKVFQIEQAMETGKGQGMMTMKDSIHALKTQGVIAQDVV